MSSAQRKRCKIFKHLLLIHDVCMIVTQYTISQNELFEEYLVSNFVRLDSHLCLEFEHKALYLLNNEMIILCEIIKWTRKEDLLNEILQQIKEKINVNKITQQEYVNVRYAFKRIFNEMMKRNFCFTTKLDITDISKS